MKLRVLKKVLMMFSIASLSLVIFSCGGNNSSEQKISIETMATDEEDKFDGNVMEVVEIDNGIFSKTLSKPFKKDKDTYSKKEQKNIDRVTEVLKDIDLNADGKILECLYGDIDSGISVWSLMNDKNGETLNNYGIVIRNNGKNYPFPEICHGNNPEIDVDEEKGIVMISGGLMEGTGTHTEGLYILNVKADKVEQVLFVDPYDVQNYFAEHVKFDVDNNNIKFKENNKVLTEAVNHEDGQGTLRAIAIGDQISFDFGDNHNVTLSVAPGLQFVSTVTPEQLEKDVVVGGVVMVASGSQYVAVVKDNEGKKASTNDDEKVISNNPQSIGTTTVLLYDDMPTFTADVIINNDKVEFKNIRIGE